jgi:hypothetical protein
MRARLSGRSSLPITKSPAGTRTNFMPRLFSMIAGRTPLQADSKASDRQARRCGAAVIIVVIA